MLKIKALAIWLWELPQHILAFVLLLYFVERITLTEEYRESTVVWLKPGADFGCSLGEFIFVTRGAHDSETVKHEFGHTRQSRILGPLYLLIVGIPSMIRHLIARSRQRRNIPYYEIHNWYYRGFPEKWADRLGNVNRTEYR